MGGNFEDLVPITIDSIVKKAHAENRLRAS
jgi:hypothetical protein